MEEAIHFLGVEEVTILHDIQIELFGGTTGLRDANMLASAVFQPQQTFGGEYVYSTLAEMATAYWYGLTMNHAFVDGNKRVGLFACSVFLRNNGFRLTLTEEEATEVSLKLAAGMIPREVLARIVGTHMEPR